jgi:hypothetical protein
MNSPWTGSRTAEELDEMDSVFDEATGKQAVAGVGGE